MLMDAAKISEIIRMKKKKMMSEAPEVVSNHAPQNPNDIYDMEMQGRIESTLNTPEKINADDKYGMGYDGVGLSPEEKARMPRLRKYLDMMAM